MRTHARIAAIASFAAAVLAAGSAQAAFIAGWDFTQYAGGGTMVLTENGDAYDTLRANYSDFDSSFGAGGDSQPFGTMYASGANGSTNVDELGAPDFAPTARR